MKRFFSFSFQHKVLLVFILMLNLPFVFTGYMATNLTEGMILQEKEHKLLALARILDTRLGVGGYEAILEKNDTQASSREEKILILNNALHGITDEVGLSSPGLGVGYYSKELDAIITYGPSSLFEHAVGLTIPPDHPGRIVMKTNKPMIKTGTMVRGDILNAMFPVERNGEVIGYIWANELTTDISAQLAAMARNVLLVMALCFGITVIFLLLLSRRTVKNIDKIITGVREMRHDINTRIEASGGELGEVVNSINAMAADIGKSKEESDRAIAILQSVLSNVEAVVYVCDPETRRIVYSNDYLCKLLERGDPAGEICHEALHNSPTPCSFCSEKDLFDNYGTPSMRPVRWEMHHERLGKDFLVTDRLVTWHDGRLLHMEMATDVTERRALAVAEAANKAQKDFLARMSHEIRTPMNGVLGMTRLAMKTDPAPEQLEYLKKIQASAALLLGIINDILDFSRIEAGKLTIEKNVFSLTDMVENIRELILPNLADKNLELKVSVDDSVPEYAVGDVLRLSQVLLNLLGNASKFTLKGSIELDMRAEKLPSGKLRLDCAVKDSGIGMTEEQQRALFKPFSQADISTSRKFGGTGLGLSICKALVEGMGGSIGVHSEPDVGSVFSFSVILKQFDGSPDIIVARESNVADTDFEGRKFLLVEDNIINQEIALAILDELGAETDTAANGQEGLNRFLAQDYSLILMDVRMPVMDGLEATRLIRKSGKHDAGTIPIIAMTANAMQEDKEAVQQAGMDGHIAKPIDLAELTKEISRLLKNGR